jgi:hippurate hydrolase
MVHNPGYDFNDRILPVAASYWVQLTEHFLVADTAADSVVNPATNAAA